MDGVASLIQELRETYPFLDDFWARRLIRAYGTEVGGLSSTKSCSRAAAMALFYYNPIQVSICLIESRRGMFT